ncbi:23S rRNA (pseudouridine(1915)-N(3))-methyltransferase RlmH [Parapedobacter sp. GCM10030251]|uniref:23S rRNA (pseudouridine(1915)-N(3))-methyltransferase RlmH n=1 Tax=Parapedobacter sp. GCM10030251 TaxID=3273419 RepID=UPI003615961C
MRITLLCIGKTDDPQLKAMIDKFEQRLKHYIHFHLVLLPDVKNAKSLSMDVQRAKEAVLIEKHVSPGDQLILLDEHGKAYRSVEFAEYLNKLMVSSTQHVVFVIGGPYGFDKRIYQQAKAQLSLSKMTFSHQMIRLLFVEQLYRAFTILKREPYHHE